MVAPEPEPVRDGDASSALGGVACETSHASTTCRVAFLPTIGAFTSLYTSTKPVMKHFVPDYSVNAREYAERIMSGACTEIERELRYLLKVSLVTLASFLTTFFNVYLDTNP